MEQGTHNPLVLGSNPGGPTINYLVRAVFRGSDFFVPRGPWANFWQIIFYEDFLLTPPPRLFSADFDKVNHGLNFRSLMPVTLF